MADVVFLASSVLWTISVAALVVTDIAQGRRIRYLEQIVYGLRRDKEGRPPAVRE